MFLHNILDSDQVKSQYIDSWMKNGYGTYYLILIIFNLIIL